MKCGACNYEYEIDYTVKGKQIIKGDEDFIDIEGTFFMKRENRWYGDDHVKVSLVACPKCKTIILEN